MAIAAGGAAVVVAAGIAIAILTLGSGSGHPAGTAAAHVRRVRPLRVLSVTPAPDARNVSGTGQIRVIFSAPLAPGSALPALSPAIAGTWERSGATEVFTPATGFSASTPVTVSVPAGGSGARSAAGGTLAATWRSSFSTGAYSTLRLQQVLAQLGYLPVTWTPAAGMPAPQSSQEAQLAAAYSPPPGQFSLQPGYPGRLSGFWRPGLANTLDKGAVTAFESDHQMTMDGSTGPRVWNALLRAVISGHANTHGYSYAIASEGSPETLTIWHDGREVFTSLANTGIPNAPTPVGTFPVYERMPFQIMSGTNPNGSHYADPVQWVSYFAGGAAVHYFPRGGYGYQQSLGCVELPYGPAERAYRFLNYGTLVTVSP